MAGRRVVITGIGPVTPVGLGDAMWDGIVSGRSGIRVLESVDTSRLPVKVGAEVRDFVPEDWMGAKEARRTDRVSQFAVAASKLAWRDAGEPDLDRNRVGVFFSTGIGGLGTVLAQHDILQTRGPDRVSAFAVPMFMPNAAAGHVAMAFGFTGPNECITTACAAGGHAVGEAFHAVRDGRVETAVAGGTEACILELTLAAFAQMQALSRNPDPATASRPFDAERDGFVLGEGACALVLEEAEQALARGATIYAEIAGFGASADAYHISAPEPEGAGALQALVAALREAGEPPDAIDYINAHGTSTPLNDAAETKLIKHALGRRAYEVPVSSTKSMTGHMLGAAGAVEAAITAKALAEGVLPPTIGYEHPDAECDLDYVPNEARTADIRFALSNAFGFGGQNAVLAFRRFEG